MELTIIVIIVASTLILMVGVLSFINQRSNSRWFCDKLGWHKHPNEMNFDGNLTFGICPRCGEQIFRDESNNWY